MKFRQSVGTRLAVTLGLMLALLLAAGYLWLQHRSKSVLYGEVKERALLTSESLAVSLKSIMLAGRGDVAHDWLARVAKLPDVNSARIFRVDGTEAFIDRQTIDRVNGLLGEQRFHRQAAAHAPSHIPAAERQAFNLAVQGKLQQYQAQGREQLAILYPIKSEDACMQCHGYTDNPVRGVLVLDVSTSKAAAAFAGIKREIGLMFAGVVGFLVLVTGVCVRSTILAPLARLADSAQKVKQGDLAHRIGLQRQDEIGTVAAVLDEVIEHLEQEIAYEQRLRSQQEVLTDAVISLSERTLEESVLQHVGELAMHLMQARYTMLGYKDKSGEMRFIPLGMSEEEKRAISHLPTGLGILGLLWEGHQTVWIDDISTHPAGVGFPPGHPPMKSFLGSAIMFGNEMLGAIYLTDRLDGKPFGQEDANMLRVLAAACAVALANARNLESLRQARDELEQRVEQRTRELTEANLRLRGREVELELMNEELTRANEAKNQFLANTSHELRTPLNAIIGFSDLLGNPQVGKLSDKQQRYVSHIHSSGKRLLTIINELLDISKIEAGMMAIDETHFVPAMLAGQVFNELMPLAKAKQIDMRLHRGTDAELVVYSDADKLHQILINIVGNAIKFTPDHGSVDIDIRCEQGAGDECLLVAEVSDTGIGIAAEDQERIFEPFVQARGGLDRKHGGTGLGLALSRKQAAMLGGNLLVESRLHEGSRFILELPVHLPHQQQEEERQPVAAESLQAAPQPVVVIEEVTPIDAHRPRILVADNDAGRGEAVVGMLEEDGYSAYYTPLEGLVDKAEQLCPFIIAFGISDRADETHRYMQLIRRHETTRGIPIVLIGGDAEAPQFSMGTVLNLQHGEELGRHELLDMIARHNRYIPLHHRRPMVLVVDDDASVREFLKEMLVAEGYRVLLSATGEEGVKLAVEREPDLIILDLMMPDITGFDVVNRLHRHPTASDIPILIYTAKDLTREESLRLGSEVERVLIKGVSSRAEIVRQMHRLELMYPVQAHLVDATLQCFNRRYLMRRLDQELSNAIRHSKTFSMVGWEMDGLDDYAGEHGVRWATAALKEMLETVKLSTRRGDICARIEEGRFVLLLPGISPQGAMRVAEKLRIRIRHQRFSLPQDERGKLTGSFALVHFEEGVQRGDEMLGLLQQRIDRAVSAKGDTILVEDD